MVGVSVLVGVIDGVTVFVGVFVGVDSGVDVLVGVGVGVGILQYTSYSKSSGNIAQLPQSGLYIENVSFNTLKLCFTSGADKGST